MKPKRNFHGKTAQSHGSGITGFTFRGNRHHPDLWKTLLPNARAKLIANGLFTSEGKITDKGRSMLSTNNKLAT